MTGGGHETRLELKSAEDWRMVVWIDDRRDDGVRVISTNELVQGRM